MRGRNARVAGRSAVLRLNPGPGVAQAHGAVEDESFRRGVAVQAKVTLSLELQGLAQWRRGQARLQPAVAERHQGVRIEVVEHVPDVPRFMSACASLVRPGGTMFVATINRTLASFALAIVGAEYVLRWLPRGTHRWGWFPRPEELEHHLERAGMPVVARTGVRVNPLTRHFALTSIMAVNYMLVAARPVHGRA